MPIDLVIDERDTKPDLGDNNNSSSNGSGGPGAGMGGASNGGRGGSADPGHHSDSASTPDHQVLITYLRNLFFRFFLVHSHTHIHLYQQKLSMNERGVYLNKQSSKKANQICANKLPFLILCAIN